MTKKTVTLLSFVFLSAWGISQGIFADNIFYPSVGLSVQKHLFGELGVSYGSGDFTCGSCGSEDIFFSKFSSEFTFNNNSLILGPKFSLEYVYEFAGARINLIDYTDFKVQDLRFTPEIGFSFCGIFAIYYGYNIPLSTDRISCVSGNRLTLTATLPGVL